MTLTEHEIAMNEVRSEVFYEVGSILRYEYEGPYTQSDIEEFFDRKGDEIIELLNKQTKQQTAESKAMTSSKAHNARKTAQIIELHKEGVEPEGISKKANVSVLHVNNVIANIYR